MSGHSKWSTIKRKKGANDAKRGKLFAKLIEVSKLQPRMVVLIQIIMLHFIKRLVKLNLTQYQIQILTMH